MVSPSINAFVAATSTFNLHIEDDETEEIKFAETSTIVPENGGIASLIGEWVGTGTARIYGITFRTLF